MIWRKQLIRRQLVLDYSGVTIFSTEGEVVFPGFEGGFTEKTRDKVITMTEATGKMVNSQL